MNGLMPTSARPETVPVLCGAGWDTLRLSPSLSLLRAPSWPWEGVWEKAMAGELELRAGSAAWKGAHSSDVQC